MKNYLKNEIKHLPMIVIVSIIFCGINTFANNHLFNSKDVDYDNSNTHIESTNVGDAIDELFNAANNFTTYDTRLQGVETKVGTGTLNTTAQNLIGGVNELNGNITHIDDHKRAYFYYASATSTMTLTFPLEQGWGVIKAVGNNSERYLFGLYRQDSSGIGFIIPISKGSKISYRTSSDATNPTSPGVLILTKDSGGFAVEYENLRPQSELSVMPTFS